jgi:hypothetical protein
LDYLDGAVVASRSHPALAFRSQLLAADERVKRSKEGIVMAQNVRVQTDTVFDTVSDSQLTPQREFGRARAKNSRKNNGRGERI